MQFRNFEVDDPVNSEFLKIVDAIGHGKKLSWTQVARLLYQRTGVGIKKTYSLRKRWRILTKQNDDEPEENEQIMYQLGIKNRGRGDGGWQEFKYQTGSKILLDRYTYKVGQFLRFALRNIQAAYLHKVQSNMIRRALVFDRSYVPIYSMLKSCDMNFPDPQFIELKQSGILLEKLIMSQINCPDNKCSRFDKFMQIANRNEVKRLFYYFEYCGELVKISQGIYDPQKHDRHPLMKKTIEENKDTIYYRYLVDECDWQEKLQLYNSSISHNQQYTVLIKLQGKSKIITEDPIKVNGTQQTNKKSSKVQIKQIEQQKRKRFYGHYIQKGQLKTTGVTTIQFDHDVDSEDIEKENSENEAKIQEDYQMKQQLQQLFLCTFGKDDEEMKKKKNKKKKVVDTF